MRNWYTMKVVEDDEDEDEDKKKNPFAEIVIYDAIGKSFFDDTAISAKDFIDALGAIDPKVEEIRLRINSPGGDVFDGVAIYNALKNHKAKVTAHVDGIAASIASVIAMAADRIVMPSNAFMLVHNSQGFSMGTAEDMRALASDLDRIDKSIIATYTARTGTAAAKVRALMKEDRLMDAKEAKELGFADEVSSPVRMHAHFSSLHMLPKAAAARFLAETGTEQGDPPHSAPGLEEPGDKPDAPPVPPIPRPEQAPPPPPQPSGPPAAKVVAIRDAAHQQGIADHQAYVSSVTDLCVLARVPERVGAYVRANKPVDQVRKELLTMIAEPSVLPLHPLITTTAPTAKTWDKITDKMNARNNK